MLFLLFDVLETSHLISITFSSLYAFSLHYFRRESLDSPLGQQIIKLRPLEEDIDQAALQDIELFG